MAANQVIVVGGGLAGLSAAHSVLQHGGTVLLLDKSAFLGGNSTKATSGINGTYTQAQADARIPDSPDLFLQDTALSFHGGKPGGAVSPLTETLVKDSGAAVQWLVEKFGVDLSVVGQMGGHSEQRTHRGKEKFPGMTCTYALMDALEKVEKATNGQQARIINKARVTRLVRDGVGAVVGCVYEKGGEEHEAKGAVIIASGGFAADFTPNSLLATHRKDLMHLSTTNGEHCTGDGCKMATAAGAALVDMERVQVHPSGLVHPDEPDAKVKFLAAEALRGTGALVVNADGQRFMNELGRRDYCSGEMFKNKGPFRLLLNSKCAKEIHWHCKHYHSRGLMKHFKTGAELAAATGIPESALAATFRQYNDVAAKGAPDQFGKKRFKNAPWDMSDSFYVAQITPVLHYTMGGIKVNEMGQVIDPKGGVIPGLFAAGEVAGGVHGINRLGGNSLLDCVVYGRVTGREVCKFLLSSLLGPGARRVGVIQAQIDPSPAAPIPTSLPNAPEPAVSKPATPQERKKFTSEEVAKHNKESDCWVIVGKLVLDVTKFLPDHPGGAKAILLYAGKDATEEFDMLHKREVIDKYAPEAVIGEIA